MKTELETACVTVAARLTDVAMAPFARSTEDEQRVAVAAMYDEMLTAVLKAVVARIR